MMKMDAAFENPRHPRAICREQAMGEGCEAVQGKVTLVQWWSSEPHKGAVLIPKLWLLLLCWGYAQHSTHFVM